MLSPGLISLALSPHHAWKSAICQAVQKQNVGQPNVNFLKKVLTGCSCPLISTFPPNKKERANHYRRRAGWLGCTAKQTCKKTEANVIAPPLKSST
jgi:hypothetical protein